MHLIRGRLRLLIAALILIAVVPGAVGIAHAETGSAYPRVWASTAPVYQQLPGDAPVDAHSKSIVQNLKKYGIEQYGVPARDLPSMNLAAYRFSNPIWFTKGSDPAYDIQFSDCQNKGYLPSEFENLKSVNIPDGAEPASGTDGQLTVINTDTGRYVDLWRAYKLKGRWFACWGGSIASSYVSDGIFQFPKGVSASGAALEPYTVKTAELRAGHIDHVIGLAVPPQVIDNYVSKPMARTDGTIQRSEKTISEGQLLRLPADLDLDSLNLHPVAKTIAKAAQEYGFVVLDGAGGINISVQNAASFDEDPYPALFGKADTWNVMWGGRNWQYDAFPFDKMQALTRDYVPQPSVTIDVTDSREKSFGFKATGAPSGARLSVTWWRNGQGQFTTVKDMNWWSGTQVGYRHAQAKVIDAHGNTLAISPVIRAK